IAFRCAPSGHRPWRPSLCAGSSVRSCGLAAGRIDDRRAQPCRERAMEEHTVPPSPHESLPRMTRGALLRRAGGGAGIALAAAAPLSPPTMSIAKAATAATRRSTMAAKPSIVFAHGLWADGSCFSKVIPALQAEGHQVVSAQNSLDSLKG